MTICSIKSFSKGSAPTGTPAMPNKSSTTADKLLKIYPQRDNF